MKLSQRLQAFNNIDEHINNRSLNWQSILYDQLYENTCIKAAS